MRKSLSRRLCVCVCVCVRARIQVRLFATPWTPQGSSVHGIFQARILNQVAISSSRGSSQSRDQTDISCASCIGRHSLPLTPLPRKPRGILPPTILLKITFFKLQTVIQSYFFGILDRSVKLKHSKN
ncbi:unnamed protein product [Rangifer tarandus platyrhynchus]|uniref:Secreted protein n=1 Tax=Rangifer tarandus platyrhynchus TaxID=3082113 RepID=A0ABN8Z5R7_RANTA|nr:unnamed protein product [Rangifer tarandus platyrhynchus]